MTSTETSGGSQGLRFRRHFTRQGENPFDTVEWEERTAVITSREKGSVFRQEGVAFPKGWSEHATNIVVSNYFRGNPGTPEREVSARQLIERVSRTITEWAGKDGYLRSEQDLRAFGDELTHILLHQKAAFNSPVWFNVGIEEKPQCSACFINSVEDTMESILGLAQTEGMLFKYGSGTGTNLSPLRSSSERLGGGGTASGPVSFMKGYDAFAGVIKSGGKTRRAAKMVVLNADHPDILEFINCKANEERKAWALIDAGYDGSFTGEAYQSVFFQNSNNSVRVTDEFMKAVENDEPWETRAVSGNRQVVRTYPARKLMRAIAEAAHVCGDPGMQFDTTINDWHTCPETARIEASNPCSEYMFLDDSACNLASLNLTKFLDPDTGEFQPDQFRACVRIMITAMEVIVGNASYPTEKIARNSHQFRPLGLGYANLGALLMSQGLAYDSDRGRARAALITALMTGEAYAQSARIARDCGGPFDGYGTNRSAFLRVMEKHRSHVADVPARSGDSELRRCATEVWDDALSLGKAVGYRNAQATVLAPTGTIAFLMDCDTTGVEPELALVKRKQLAGGGDLRLINRTVPKALRTLGYDDVRIGRILEHMETEGTIEGADELDDTDLAVFDCAYKPKRGSRSIHYLGHLKMVAATQPFVSGAISKTINLPREGTVEDLEKAYQEAWRLGTKAVAVYRDGSKRTQPLSAEESGKESATASDVESDAGRPIRRKLPDERRSITHKFDIAGHEGYITVGMFDDGSPGEIFLVMAKEGSTISGLADSYAQAISYSLQYGVPLEVLVDKFSHQRFEPAGMTRNPEVRFAKSIVDYLFRWLATKFLDAEAQERAGVNMPAAPAGEPAASGGTAAGKGGPATSERQAGQDQKAPRREEQGGGYEIENDLDAPSCSHCGSIMVRSGTCYKCANCGTTSGCG